MLRRLLAAVMAVFILMPVLPADAKIHPLKEDDFEYELNQEDIDDEGYEILIVYNTLGGKCSENYYDGVSADGSKGYMITFIFCDEWVDDDDEYYYQWQLGAEPTGEYVSRKGYKFEGWYEDPEYTQEFRSTRGTSFPDKVYLYAKWTEVWKKGWREVDNGWKYSLEEGKDYTNGVYKIGSKYYGFDKNGFMVKGWKKFSGSWYYFLSSGAAVTGWKKISGKWYWFTSEGKMVTGWQKISGKWYYFNASGAMLTGWQKISGKWYYFESSGAMVTGWKKIGGKWYYFQSSGAMKTGWLKLSGKWYYFNSSGAMVTGTVKIGSKTYTFNSSGVCQNP